MNTPSKQTLRQIIKMAIESDRNSRVCGKCFHFDGTYCHNSGVLVAIQNEASTGSDDNRVFKPHSGFSCGYFEPKGDLPAYLKTEPKASL